jgi:hypothetical protein
LNQLLVLLSSATNMDLDSVKQSLISSPAFIYNYCLFIKPQLKSVRSSFFYDQSSNMVHLGRHRFFSYNLDYKLLNKRDILQKPKPLASNLLFPELYDQNSSNNKERKRQQDSSAVRNNSENNIEPVLTGQSRRSGNLDLVIILNLQSLKNKRFQY